MKNAEVSSRRCARLTALVLTLAATGVCAPVAGAQEPGVVYEPGSPSYKEYAIPLEEARRDAGGGEPNGIDSRAFGIGLSSKAGRGASAGGRSAKGGGGSAGRGSEAGKRGGEKGEKDAGPAEVARRLAEAETADAPAFWSFGVLLLALLPGLVLALLLALRGGRQRPPTTS
jgi:hypothetical protein